MILERIPEISKLSPEDKLRLANELWQQVAEDPDRIPVSDEHKQLIEQRYQEYLENPDDVVTWEEVKRRLGKS